MTEPSPPVHVPKGHRVLAGTAKAAGMAANKKAGITFPRSDREDSIKAMVVKWDSAEKVDVPHEVAALYRGSVANFKTKAEEVRVKEGILKEVDAVFDTDLMIVDILGGDKLTSSRKNDKTELTSPGEFLVMDEAGNLSVRHEFEDEEAYKANTFAPPVDLTQGLPGSEGYYGEGPGNPDDPYGTNPGRRGRNRRSRGGNYGEDGGYGNPRQRRGRGRGGDGY